MRKFICPVAAALALLLLLASCGPSYDYSIDMKNYSSAIHTADKAYRVLVNKQNPVGESHVPASLSPLPTELTLYGKTVEMETTAALAAEALLYELHARGYTDIVATSGYRSYAYQQTLLYTYLAQEREKHPDWTEAQCLAEVATYSARPGESEHQTGLCVDLISTELVVLDERFADHPVYAYLVENAHSFGFILRFPEGKESVTGYSFEPWHYRFVGVETATTIHEKGLTLEEYLG